MAPIVDLVAQSGLLVLRTYKGIRTRSAQAAADARQRLIQTDPAEWFRREFGSRKDGDQK